MNPEYERERIESYHEKRRLSENIGHDLLRALEAGRDSMPDIITCPNPACGNPLQVRFLEDRVEIVCPNCEFRQVLKSSQLDA